MKFLPCFFVLHDFNIMFSSILHVKVRTTATKTFTGEITKLVGLKTRVKCLKNAGRLVSGRGGFSLRFTNRRQNIVNECDRQGMVSAEHATAERVGRNRRTTVRAAGVRSTSGLGRDVTINQWAWALQTLNQHSMRISCQRAIANSLSRTRYDNMQIAAHSNASVAGFFAERAVMIACGCDITRDILPSH